MFQGDLHDNLSHRRRDAVAGHAGTVEVAGEEDEPGRGIGIETADLRSGGVQDAVPPLVILHRAVERIREVGCHGDLFRETPAGFDKLYYFDEGTFGVSYYVNLPSGERVSCYAYNSVYSTLSSGREIVSRIADPAALQTRTHTAPDGTELTILRGGEQVFLYTYLEGSFLEEEISGAADLSDADVDYIADFLLYQNIGK